PSPLWGVGEGRKVRSDGLTPAHSHRELVKKLAMDFDFLLLIDQFFNHPRIVQRLAINDVNCSLLYK
ncbi:hypothetical protein, partial [Enterobacter hormaechei]